MATNRVGSSVGPWIAQSSFDRRMRIPLLRLPHLEPEGLFQPAVWATCWRPGQAQYGRKASTSGSIVTHPPQRHSPRARASSRARSMKFQLLEPGIAARQRLKTISLALQCARTPLPATRFPLADRWDRLGGNWQPAAMRARPDESVLSVLWPPPARSAPRPCNCRGVPGSRVGVVALTAAGQTWPWLSEQIGQPLPRGWWPWPIPTGCSSSKAGLMPLEALRSARPPFLLLRGSEGPLSAASAWSSAELWDRDVRLRWPAAPPWPASRSRARPGPGQTRKNPDRPLGARVLASIV